MHLGRLLGRGKKRASEVEVISALWGWDSSSPQIFRAALIDEAMRDRSKSIVVKKSSVPNAGVGVFAAASVPRGTVLSTYGGRYIPPVPITPFDGLIAERLTDLSGDYIYCCENGGFLDGKLHHGMEAEFPAFAQFANHPPRERIPNAVCITVWPFPKHYGVHPLPAGEPWYYDNENEKVVTMPESIMLKGVILVSLADLEEGEEIFFDYQINPRESRPSWYSPVKDDGYLDDVLERTLIEENGVRKRKGYHV